MLKRYSYRAHPTVWQQRSLARLFGSVRTVFNDVIAERRRAHKAGEPFISASRMQTLVVTQAKHATERAWLTEVSSTPLEQAVRDADLAYRNFFNSITGKRKGRRVGAPRFKKRGNRQTARFTRSAGFVVRSTTHGVAHLRIPKVGWVRFVLSRGLPADPSSVTVIREPDGSYHVSFVVDEPEQAPVSPEHDGRTAGIDVGLTDYAAIVYSDGTREKIANPRHLRASEKKLAHVQRELSRKQKGSKNRAKARVRVARAHARVRHQRLDHAHQLAARLIRENQAVTVETLSITGMVKTRLAKSVSDAGWGQFLRILEEKAVECGRDFQKAPAGFPSSQICAVCGKRDGKKPLHVRVWQCACGSLLDRDYNAATNLLAEGHSESQNACGRKVRLQLAGALPDEAGPRRTDHACEGMAA